MANWRRCPHPRAEALEIAPKMDLNSGVPPKGGNEPPLVSASTLSHELEMRTQGSVSNRQRWLGRTCRRPTERPGTGRGSLEVGSWYCGATCFLHSEMKPERLLVFTLGNGIRDQGLFSVVRWMDFATIQSMSWCLELVDTTLIRYEQPGSPRTAALQNCCFGSMVCLGFHFCTTQR